MKDRIVIFALIMCLSMVAPVLADSPTNVLGTCLVDHLNGIERKNLAKWIFFSIASHPELKSYSKASANDVTKSDQNIGKLITRLLTEDCPSELRTANSADPQALENAFSLVGRVAMQELMTNQEVTKAISNYTEYADMEKINKILSGDKVDVSVGSEAVVE